MIIIDILAILNYNNKKDKFMYCYMLVAVPGSGKSTLVEALQKDMPQLGVVSSDVHIERYAKEKNKTRPGHRGKFKKTGITKG